MNFRSIWAINAGGKTASYGKGKGWWSSFRQFQFPSSPPKQITNSFILEHLAEKRRWAREALNRTQENFRDIQQKSKQFKLNGRSVTRKALEINKHNHMHCYFQVKISASNSSLEAEELLLKAEMLWFGSALPREMAALFWPPMDQNPVGQHHQWHLTISPYAQPRGQRYLQESLSSGAPP